jgi:hypothetical protein
MLKYETMQMVLDSKIEFIYHDPSNNSRQFIFRKKSSKINALLAKIHDNILVQGGKMNYVVNEEKTIITVSE